MQRHRLYLPSSFSSLYLHLSVSLFRSRAVQMKCRPHVRPVKEGSPGCFFPPCRGFGALHLTLCFNANDSFISPVLLTCATWQGSLRNPSVTMATGQTGALWQKWRFAPVCLTAPSVRGRFPRGAPTIKTKSPKRRSSVRFVAGYSRFHADLDNAAAV